MAELEKRKLVQHASLGTGKVVALEPTAVHVFFPQRAERFAVKLRLPAAQAYLSAEGVTPDPWLEGLSAFSLDAASGRYGLPAAWMPQADVLAQLAAAYPGGLGAPQEAAAGRSERAPAWRAAHARFEELLGNGEGERLLAAGDVAELVRRAGRVTRPTGALLLVEGDPLAELLSSEETAAALFGAVFELVAAPASARAPAEGLFALVARAGLSGAAAWTAATLLPFIAQPHRHPLLHPPIANAAADRIGCDFDYAEPPTWKTYAAFRSLSSRLLSWLEPHGGRDLVEVECFLDVLANRKGPARAAKSAAAAGARASSARPAARAKAAVAGRATRAR